MKESLPTWIAVHAKPLFALQQTFSLFHHHEYLSLSSRLPNRFEQWQGLLICE
jgi:hypothetical protein